MKTSKSPQINKMRVSFFSILFMAATVAHLVFFCDFFLETIHTLETGETEAPNAIWLVKFVSYLLPVLTLIFLQYLAYAPTSSKKFDPISAHREMAAETFIVLAFIYAVMLPTVIIISNSAEPELLGDGTVAKTLFEKTAMWFGYQAVPYLVVGIYHRIKYKAELEGDSEDEI